MWPARRFTVRRLLKPVYAALEELADEVVALKTVTASLKMKAVRTGEPINASAADVKAKADKMLAEMITGKQIAGVIDLGPTPRDPDPPSFGPATRERVVVVDPSTKRGRAGMDPVPQRSTSRRNEGGDDTRQQEVA